MSKHYFFIRESITVVLLALLLCTPVLAAGEDEARAILNRMSAEIAALEQFVVTGDGYVDARLGAGQIIEHSNDVVLRISKPDTLRITSRSAELMGEIFFGGGVLTVYNQTNNFYAQTPMPAGLDAAVDFAINEIGIEAPVLELISSDVGSFLLEDADSVDYFGLSLFRGGRYHHIGIRSAEVDLQLWISADGAPLPGKMAISSKWEAGAPRSVFFFSWDTEPEIKLENLKFKPPPGAIKIEFDRGVEQ